MKHVFKIVMGILTGVATLFGIGGGSIWLNDHYLQIKTELTDLRLSKLADAQKTTIASLNDSIAQMTKAAADKNEEWKRTVGTKNSEYEKLREQYAIKCAEYDQRIVQLAALVKIQELHGEATKDQDAYNAELLNMYSFLVKTISTFGKSYFIIDLHTSLVEYRKKFEYTMEAKGLAKAIDIKGQPHLVLTAYPFYGVNKSTGEFATLETPKK